MHALASRRASTVIDLSISSSLSSYDIFTAAGSPATPVYVTLTIQFLCGVEALSTGTGWAAGSILKLVNKGSVHGATHDAINLGWDITISNFLGTIGTTGSGFKAIDLNGHAVTWMGGNNSSQVRGAVA